MKDFDKITLSTFLTDFGGHGNRYVSYMLIGKGLCAAQVVDMLNSLDPKLLPYNRPFKDGDVASGYVTEGKNGYNAVSFEISKGDLCNLYDFTAALHCIGYADEAWNTYFTEAAFDGHPFADFTAAWIDDCPLDREENDEDGKYWDAFFDITDNASGIVFHSGAGAVDDSTKEYYADFVKEHSKSSRKNGNKAPEKYVAEKPEIEGPVKIVYVTYCTMGIPEVQAAYISAKDNRTQISYEPKDVMSNLTITVDYAASFDEAVQAARERCKDHNIFVEDKLYYHPLFLGTSKKVSPKENIKLTWLIRDDIVDITISGLATGHAQVLQNDLSTQLITIKWLNKPVMALGNTEQIDRDAINTYSYDNICNFYYNERN